MSQHPTTVADLRPNPKNPRKITDKRLAMLKRAVEKFGDLGGIVYNRRSGQLVGGHQRAKVLPPDAQVRITTTHAEPTPTGTVAEGHIDVEGEHVAYRVVDWDDVTEKAANLAANKGAGEFDMPQVAEWIGELDTGDFDMDLTMFDVDELAGIMAPVGGPEDDGSGDGDGDLEPPVDPITQPGDIYKLGRHRLVCGDCTDRATIDALFDGARADATFTSPPYNAGAAGYPQNRGQKRNPGQKSNRGQKRRYNNYSDDLSEDDFVQLLNTATVVALAFSEYAFVNLQMLSGNRKALSRYQYDLRDQLKDVFVWNKKRCPPNIIKGVFNAKWEYVYCFANDAKTRGFPCTWQGQHPNVVEVENNSSNEHSGMHRAGFPLALPAWFFERLPFIKTVFDPFCGTGTTLVCAEKMNKTCYASEIDPAYCDIIVTRWEQHTGQKAERVGSVGNGTETVVTHA